MLAVSFTEFVQQLEKFALFCRWLVAPWLPVDLLDDVGEFAKVGAPQNLPRILFTPDSETQTLVRSKHRSPVQGTDESLTTDTGGFDRGLLRTEPLNRNLQHFDEGVHGDDDTTYLLCPHS